MSIQVNDFQWEPGKNDAEYIKLLESSRDSWQKLAQKAIARLKGQVPKGAMYPTWMEWLAANVPGVDADSIYEAVRVLNRTRIPADIAQRLGLEPNEGV